MKRYVCKTCGHKWQSDDSALECIHFGCGSRLIHEVSCFMANDIGGGVAVNANAIFSCLRLSLVFFVIAALSMFVFNRTGLFDVLLFFCIPLFVFGLVAFLIGWGLLLLRMYDAWQVVQPAECLGRGLKIPSPGKAIGYLFIPFFNLYWMFIAFKGLMDLANALKEDRHIPGVPFCAGAATGHAIVSVIACCSGIVTLYVDTAYDVASVVSPIIGSDVATAYVNAAYALAGVVRSIIGPLLSPLAGLVACCLLFPITRDVVRIINMLR